MAKYNIFLKKSALKQLRLLPKSSQDLITNSISLHLTVEPYKADGKHIKKLAEGYRLRVGNYRIFYSERKNPDFQVGDEANFERRSEIHVNLYYLEAENVTITSIVRRTSTTY